MAEHDSIREVIRRGEERLNHSRSTLERLKSAESETARILRGKNGARKLKPQST